jgi:acetyl-CoA carboxylase carboxyl transferase subunit alpha
MSYLLDFEKPVLNIENQIKELKEASGKVDLDNEIKALQNKVQVLIKDIYTSLSPWQRVQLSRHPLRPHTVDYIENVFDDFHELSGDRKFGDDKAMITGFAFLKGQKVAIIGIEKGRKTKEKIEHNFGMPNPEGYRKALRIMKMASSFDIPIISFVDTPGAYPGLGAEERGQAQAIAENLAEMFDLKVPIISIVIGEGGSGGALGIAIADKVLMMEYSIYSVISPESCASILWSDPTKAEIAANALKLTPEKALELGVIDGIITEPAGGVHRDKKQAYSIISDELEKQIKKLTKIKKEKLLENRFNKFRTLGNNSIEGLKDSCLKFDGKEEK